MKQLLQTALLIVLCALSVHAQSSEASNLQSSLTVKSTNEKSAHSSLQQDDPIAKALEQATNRLALAEEMIKLKDEQLAAKDVRIINLEGTVNLRDQQLEFAISANKDRAQVNTGDARMLASCENQLAKADARIYKLEHPGFLKSLFDTRTLSGFGLGFGAAKLQGAIAGQ